MTQVHVATLERDAELIEEFVSSLGSLSPPRLRKYRYTLGKISRELGPFEDVKGPDLREYIEEVNLSDYEDWTKHDYRAMCKKFFGWLRDKEFVSWIKLGSVKATIGPQDVLSEDDLSMMRFACKSLRDKALVETLYESACRPHEFLGLKKSDVAFDQYGAVTRLEDRDYIAQQVRINLTC